MSIEFDIGPLTWMKDEIDHALSQALALAESFAASPANATLLRHCQTNVHQVSGALSMIGLDGAHRFSVEIERYIGWLEQHGSERPVELPAILVSSVNALAAYLQELIDGDPDVPLRLFPEFKAMLEAQGEVKIQETELFFPDLSITAPSGLDVEIPEGKLLADYLAELGQDYRKYLVQWIHEDNAQEVLSRLHGILLAVERSQASPASKTLWWVAAGMLEAAAEGGVEATPELRNLCVRLERQLRHLAQGDPRPAGRLLKDVLFHLAMGRTVSKRVGEIKYLFGLDDYRQEAEPSGGEVVTISGKDDATLIEALRAAASRLKECWEQVSVSGAAYLDEFLQRSVVLSDVAAASTSENLRKALSNIHDCAEELSRQRLAPDVLFSIEMATSLLMLESVLTGNLRNESSLHHLLNQTAAVRSMVLGEAQAAPALESDQAEALAVQSQVAEEIRNNLQRIEQVLDDFFRAPDESRNELATLTGLFRQVGGALEILDLPAAASVTKGCQALVERLSQPDYHASEGEYVVIADCVSALGFYLDRLLRLDAGALGVIESLLPRLQTYLEAVPSFVAAAGLDETGQEIVETAPERVEDRPHDEELQEVYLQEAEEVLGAIAGGLETLRQKPDDHRSLTNVRRGFHTLKGSGRTVGLAAMGDVAWAVEQLLNHLMEAKSGVDETVAGFVARVCHAFGEWVNQLRANGSVTLIPGVWQAEADALRRRAPVEASEVPSEAPAGHPATGEVIIGGSRKISQQLFNLFLEEAYGNLEMLSRACSAAHKQTPPPIPDIARAAHTLGGVSRTIGFTALGELSSALENWLEFVTPRLQQLSAGELLLFDQSMSTLLGMLLHAANRRQPKPAPWLCNALSSATGKQPAPVEALAVVETPEITAVEEVAQPVGPEAKEPVATEPAIDEVAEEAPATEAAVSEAEAEQAAVAQAETSLLQEEKAEADAPGRELAEIFLQEANELMPLAGAQLRRWQNAPGDTLPQQTLQRALHTLKGSARMAGDDALGNAYHHLESLIIRATSSGKPDASSFSEFFDEFDRISDQLDVLRKTVETAPAVAVTTETTTAAAATATSREQVAAVALMRVRSDTIDRLVNDAGEISIARSRIEGQMETFKQALLELTDSVIRVRAQLREVEIEAETQMQSRMSQLQEAHETFDPLEFDRYTRFQELTRMMAESVHDVATIQQGLLYNLSETEAALIEQSRTTKELQQGLMRTRMVRFDSIAERLHRIVRQTSAELDKQAELELMGGNVEIDRSVLEKMIGPLEHLLRNAVAHGLENASVRKRRGKPAKGRIGLLVRQDGNEIILTLSDDGRGLDFGKIKSKAKKLGMYEPGMESNVASLIALIFEPGFSTADAVTQVSGRGVGLDAVRSDIASLGGRVEVASEGGGGTVFSISLPLTLAVNQAVLVRTGEARFLLPATMVEQVQKFKPAVLADYEQKRFVPWGGNEYPVHHLSHLLAKPVQPEPQSYVPVLLLRSGARRIALIVDEISGNREIVVKNIGPQLSGMPGIAGATVMGDGQILLVLNPVQLAYRETVMAGAMHHAVEAAAEVERQHVPTIMAVDDSLTMRKVITRLLTREGYHVLTAKDGVDALQQLQSVMPDVMLVDIEMPRMDGFELTRAIRGDDRTAHIPIIVISSRTADKHRKYAAELGVNVYLGKPYQEDELLSHISRFLRANAEARALAKELSS